MVHERAKAAEDQGVSTGVPSQSGTTGESGDSGARSGVGSSDESGDEPSPTDPDFAYPAPIPDNGVVLLAEQEIEAANRNFERRQKARQIQSERAGEPALTGSVQPTGAQTNATQTSTAQTSTDQRRETDVTATLDSPSTGDDHPSDQGSDTLAKDCQSGEHGSESVPEENEGSTVLKGIVEWVMVLVGAVLVALVFRAFLFQAFWIPSESMQGTLEVDDRVMVNRLSYRLHDVNRGDVIVFHKPEGLNSTVDDLIKRVMALEGETIEGRDGAVYVNGQRVAEPYLDPDDLIFDFGPTTVPPGHVFVMGDNRDDSTDSRVFGPIAVDTIVGRAFIIFWPVGRLEAL